MASKTPSAWSKPDGTPAPEPAREPLVVVFSGAVAEDRWAKELPTSPKGLVKLARKNGFEVEVKRACATRTNYLGSFGIVSHLIDSWSVKSLPTGKRVGFVVVWEQELGSGVAKSKLSVHVTSAYKSYGFGVEPSSVTEIKSLIEESK